MSSCAIYIKHANPAECATTIRSRSTKAGLEANPLLRDDDATQFRRLLVGAHNHARRRVKGREEAFRPMLDFILATTVVVGVPRMPKMATLATITEGFDAAVFDGHTFRSLDEKDLLA